MTGEAGVRNGDVGRQPKTRPASTGQPVRDRSRVADGPVPVAHLAQLTRISQAAPVLRLRGSQAQEYSHTSSAG